jgi:hypothetical protein
LILVRCVQNIDSLSKFTKATPQIKDGSFDTCKALLHILVGGTLGLVLTDYAEHKCKLFFSVGVNLFLVLFPSLGRNYEELSEELNAIETKNESLQSVSIEASGKKAKTKLSRKYSLSRKSPSSFFQQSECRCRRLETSEQEKQKIKDKKHEVCELNPPTILVTSSGESTREMLPCSIL